MVGERPKTMIGLKLTKHIIIFSGLEMFIPPRLRG